MKILMEFQTPCGILRCFNSDKNSIPFEIKPVDRVYKTIVYDEIQSDWIEVSNICQNICIPANSLKIGENYTCRLCGNHKYCFGVSDENSISNVVTSDGFSLSLGAYDPNNCEKDRQCIPIYDGNVKIGWKPPEHYNISAFRGYLLSVLPDWSGFSFKILDYSLLEVLLKIAWIKHNENLMTEIFDYENAVTRITVF